jgi:outer membrane protein assembly factor BamB/predicted phosphodiesterase
MGVMHRVGWRISSSVSRCRAACERGRRVLSGAVQRCVSRTRTIALILLLIPLVGGAETFRFAWLSDTHVGSTTGEEDLRSSVRDINSQGNISFVVISGDVTEYGSREQLQLAKEILDELKVPCHVVPGNHDTKWSESGGTDFPKIWGDDRFVFEYGGFRFIGMHEGPLMKMGDGHWAPQDVRWLEATLKKMPDQNQPLVFVTHYPVDPSYDGFGNYYVVLDLLKRYNIQAFLCGHIHKNEKGSFEGIPGVMARSNLRGNALAGGYTLVEVKDGHTMTFYERTPGGETKAPWHSIALEKHETGTNQFPRPDFSINTRFPAVKEQWHYDTGWTIASSPAVCNEGAVVGDASGTVYCLSLASGQPVWRFKTSGAVYSTPDTAGDLVVFASTDGNVYAIKGADGKEAWRFKTDRPIVASPRIAEGIVYVGASDGHFRALELASGKLRWDFDRLGGFVETRPLVYNGKVIFGAWDQHLYALDTKTGKLAWKWQGERRGVMYSPAACWPVGANGKVFVVAPDRRLTALDLKTGDTIYRTGSYMVRESIGLSQDQNRIYVRSMQDFFYAFSTTAPLPAKVWELNAAFGTDINSAMLSEKDGVVFYGTKSGLLFALDARTGTIKWQHKTGVALLNTIVPLSSTRVLATDFDGRVALIEERM